MAASSDARQPDVDGLYARSLDEFTAARDELARTLRGAGERDAAQEVKALRKPSLAAWALNQVSREEPAGVADLVVAGERLHAAMQRLLETRDRAPLAQATAEERELVDGLAHAGERRLTAAGHAVGAAVHTKLVATLHAVASDSEVRELLVAGRLVRDYEVNDLGLGFAPTAPAASAAPAAQAPDPRAKPARNRKGAAADSGQNSKAAAAESAQDRKAAAAERAAVARKLRSLRKQLTNAEAREQKLAAEAQAARGRLDDARLHVERATEALERAQAAMDEAQTAAADVADDVARLRASLRELESDAD